MRSLFGIATPIALLLWANATAGLVRISPVELPLAGIALAFLGATLLLPLASRFLPHHAEIGLCIICIGVSIATGSASGLWLISPIVMLSCIAFVEGYQRYRRREHFDAAWLHFLPADSVAAPTAKDYLEFFLFMVLPWLVLYEAILAIGIPPDAINGVTPFEQHLPVLEWTQIFYGSVYLMVLSVPFFAKSRRDLRCFSVRGLWTMLLAYPAFLAIPLIAPKRAFTPHSFPGYLLAWEQTLDSPVAAFPSFHVIWVLLAAEVYSRRWPRWKWFFYGWAFLVAGSCVTTGQHSLLDVAGGFATVALVTHAPRLWKAFRATRICQAEKIGRSKLIGYPASIYSFIWNVLTAITAVRLWSLAVPVHFIAGIYLIFTALGKFVEAAGYPRITRYQWAAIAMVIGGALVTALGKSNPAPSPQNSWDAVVPAVIFALVVSGGTGMVFPRRTSSLSKAA